MPIVRFFELPDAILTTERGVFADLRRKGKTEKAIKAPGVLVSRFSFVDLFTFQRLEVLKRMDSHQNETRLVKTIRFVVDVNSYFGILANCLATYIIAKHTPKEMKRYSRHLLTFLVSFLLVVNF